MPDFAAATVLATRFDQYPYPAVLATLVTGAYFMRRVTPKVLAMNMPLPCSVLSSAGDDPPRLMTVHVLAERFHGLGQILAGRHGAQSAMRNSNP